LAKVDFDTKLTKILIFLGQTRNLMQRDKASRDIFWAKDESLEKRLKRTSGRMKSLNLGASVEPLIAQAASQSQVSSIEISRCSSGEVDVLWFEGAIFACGLLFQVRRANFGALPTLLHSDDVGYLNPFAALLENMINEAVLTPCAWLESNPKKTPKARYYIYVVLEEKGLGPFLKYL
jgi:hypothetical protein